MGQEGSSIATGIESSNDTDLAGRNNFSDTIQRRSFENENAVRRLLARGDHPPGSPRMVAGRRPPVFHTPGPRPEYSKPLAQKPKLNSRTLLQCQLLMDVEGIEDRSSPKTNPRGPADSLPQLSHDRNSSPRDRIRSGSGESASSLSPITHVRNSIAFNQTPPNTNPEDLCSFAEMFHDPTNTRATGSSEMENDQGHNYAPELCSSPPQLPKLQNAQVANRAHERFHEMARTHTNLSSAHGAANGRHDDLAFQPLAPFGEPPDVGYDHMSLQPSAPVGVPVQTPWNVTGPIHMPNDQMAVQAQSPGASSRGPSIAPSAQDTLESQAPADSEPQLVTINFEVRLPNGETIMASAQVPAHTQVPNGLAVVTPAHLPSGQDASRSSQEPANMHPQLPSLPMNSPIWLPDSSMIATADPEAQKPSSQGSLPSSPPPAIEELKFRKVPVEFRGRPMTPGYHRAASPFENDAHHLVSQVPVNQRLNNALGIQSILLAKPDEILRVDDLNLPQMPGMGSAVLSYSGDYVEPVQPMGMDYGDLFGVRTAVLDEVDDDAPRALDMGDAELLGMGTAKLDNVNYEPGRALEMSDVDMELFFDFDAAAAPDTSPSPPLSMGDAELVDLTVDAPTSNASTSKFSTTNAYTLNALESVFLPQMGDPDFDHFKALADRINGLDGPLKKSPKEFAQGGKDDDEICYECDYLKMEYGPRMVCPTHFGQHDDDTCHDCENVQKEYGPHMVCPTHFSPLDTPEIASAVAHTASSAGSSSVTCTGPSALAESTDAIPAMRIHDPHTYIKTTREEREASKAPMAEASQAEALSL